MAPTRKAPEPTAGSRIVDIIERVVERFRHAWVEQLLTDGPVDGLFAEPIERFLRNAGLFAQVAVERLAAHVVDDFARGVVGAGLVAVVFLVEVLEDFAEQFGIGVDALVVRRGFLGGESIALEEPENGGVAAGGIKDAFGHDERHGAGIGTGLHTKHLLFEVVGAEKATTKVGNRPGGFRDLDMGSRALCLPEAVEEDGDQHIVEEAAGFARVYVLLVEVREEVGEPVARRTTKPALLLEEPQEQHPTQLARPEREERDVLLWVAAVKSRVVWVGSDGFGHEAVAKLAKLLMESARYNLDAELVIPLSREGRERGRAGCIQTSDAFEVESRGILKVDRGADGAGRRAFPAARQNYFGRRGLACAIEQDADPAAVLGAMLDEGAGDSTAVGLSVCRAFVPLVGVGEIEAGACGAKVGFSDAVELADTAGEQIAKLAA